MRLVLHGMLGLVLECFFAGKDVMNSEYDYVEKNYSAFQKMSFDPSSAGKYAVIYDEKLVGLFDTMIDADKAGALVDPKEEYIVQQVGSSVSVDLGFLSRTDFVEGR